MAAEEQKSLWGRFDRGFHGVGATPLFVLVNGLVIGALAFIILSHQTAGQKESEARNQTRDIIRAMEESAADAEKTVQQFAAAFAAGAGQGEAARRLPGEFMPHSLLWTTESGTYRLENMSPQRLRTIFDPESGWPGYQDLYRDTYGQRYGDVAYWDELRWPAFEGRKMSALVEKVRTDKGETGLLMVVTSPADIFGGDWARQRADVLRVTVTAHGARAPVVDSVSPDYLRPDDALFAPTEISYTLQLGGRAWDVAFVVDPTATTRFLSASPWIALSLIVFITLMASLVIEHKRAHDLRIAEMSRTLAAAGDEIQAKTSERDQLFHALRKSEREYRAVINSVSDVIFETDETGRIVFLNETWNRVTSSESADFVGKHLFDLVAPADRVKQREMFDALVRGERQAYRTETSLELGDRPRAVEVAFSMLRMTDDKSLRVVGTITDIEKRRRAEAAVREAEQRYRAIFENSVSGIYQVTPDGRFVSANPALAEILGFDTTEELMFAVPDVAQLYARREDRDEFIRKLLFEGRVSGVESEVIRKGGDRIWILENARVVRSPKGGILYYEGSLLDVTERRAAEEATRQARLQAEISSRSRMEFLANMSHELRTPLNAVIGFSEIIKGEVMGPLSVPAYKEYAQDIYDSGNYLLKVISEILEVSKIETGNRELNQTNFPVGRALKSCMTIMSSRIDQSGVSLRFDMPEDLPEILAEELGFKQILLNLIGNAIKFTGKGGAVTVSARVEIGGEMTLDIADTGIGMTEAEIGKAMQPFGKVDNNFSTMKEGTGLGLTIVNSLVRLHGGTFQLISKKGEGTTARVILPAYRVLRLSNVTPLKVQK